MNKNFILFLLAFLISSYTKAQEPNRDSLVKEAGKTVIYAPVPPSDAIILFNGKNLDAWLVTTVQKRQVGILPMAS